MHRSLRTRPGSEGALRQLALCALCAVLGGLLLPGVCRAQRAVILVRHAEKVDDSRDPPLSAAGQARAAALAHVLREAGIGAIFVTEYQRTQQTAAPLANQLGLQPSKAAAADKKGLVQQLRAHPTQVVLVVSHADTLPAIIQELGHKGPPIQIPKEAYDGLYFVVPQREARTAPPGEGGGAKAEPPLIDGKEPLLMTLRYGP